MLETIIDQHIWGLSGEMRMPGGVYFPLRMTILRLPDDQLLLHSPVTITDEAAAAIEVLGQVRWIVAPSKLHHLFFEQACARWPQAQTIAPATLRDKRPDLRLDADLEDWDSLPTLPEHLAICPIDGAPDIDEFVFLHRPTDSLLVTDLFFHILEPRGLISALVFRMAGAHKRFAQSRAWRFVFTKDRQAVARSVRAMLQWDFARIIPCHGAVLEHDAHAQATAALSWMLGSAPALPAPA